MSDALHVAIVTPWFGPQANGGAERTAAQVATGLAQRGHRVDVFTTCAREFASDWSVEHYPPGDELVDGVRVRRFRVDARNPDAFDRANEVLLSRPVAYYRNRGVRIEGEVASSFLSDGIASAAAIDALRGQLETFDAVLVLPYPYELGLAALRVAGQRGLLQPCLHDEPYAYLPAVESAFRDAGTVLFNTYGERELAYRLYGPAIALKSMVVGTWIDAATPPARRPPAVRGFRPADHRYVLYLGRRDATKNVDLLIEAFATFRRRSRLSRLELVLVGPGSHSFADPRHDVSDLGEVDEAEKAALLAGAVALAQPSTNESFSRVVMEAWSEGKPVLVNGRCTATASVVDETRGGWTATTKAQWTALFETLDRLPAAERAAAGERGRRYAESHSSRDEILDRYDAAIRALARARRTRFDVRPAPALLDRLADGRKTVLYAGPLDEASGITRLLSGFAHLLSFGVDARLVLLGAFDSSSGSGSGSNSNSDADGDADSKSDAGSGSGYADDFFSLVATAGLAQRVTVLDASSSAVVAACYRSADLLWSMSDDGPVPELVAALGYAVPIFAYANRAAATVLGPSAILFNDASDVRALAGVAALLLHDAALRETVVSGQRRRFEAIAARGELDLAG